MTPHQKKMAAKRERNRTMVAGFTPMYSTRRQRVTEPRMGGFRPAKPSKSDSAAYRRGNR